MIFDPPQRLDKDLMFATFSPRSDVHTKPRSTLDRVFSLLLTKRAKLFPSLPDI